MRYSLEFLRCRVCLTILHTVLSSSRVSFKDECVGQVFTLPTLTINVRWSLITRHSWLKKYFSTQILGFYIKCMVLLLSQ